MSFKNSNSVQVQSIKRVDGFHSRVSLTFCNQKLVYNFMVKEISKVDNLNIVKVDDVSIHDILGYELTPKVYGLVSKAFHGEEMDFPVIITET